MESQESPTAPTRRRTQTRTRELVETLTGAIRRCDWKPGDKLPTESELVATHRVSRTVVREAMSRLQASGLVETRHGIGTFLRTTSIGQQLGNELHAIITIRDVLDILELRTSLETDAAGLAAARRTDSHLRDMRNALDAFDTGIDDGDTVGPDFEFHLLIAGATGNRYFLDVMRQLGTATIPRARISAAESGDRIAYCRRLAAEHDLIYEGIASRDPEAARTAMRMHLTSSRDRLRRTQEALETRNT
jgi:GntR family transcriptional regulator, transcriptional repressor for pyruvate dehydrogenase complex